MSSQSYSNNEEYWEAQEFWHSYRLQELSAEQFATVVGRILSDDIRLVGPRRENSGSPFAGLIDT